MGSKSNWRDAELRGLRGRDAVDNGRGRERDSEAVRKRGGGGGGGKRGSEGRQRGDAESECGARRRTGEWRGDKGNEGVTNENGKVMGEGEGQGKRWAKGEKRRCTRWW